MEENRRDFTLERTPIDMPNIIQSTGSDSYKAYTVQEYVHDRVS